MEKQPLIIVRGLSKKFSKELRSSMLHGIQDWARSSFRLNGKRDTLREGEFFGVRDVNLTLREGEILAVTGANGSGKTTLMRLITGIYAANSGTVVRKDGLRITAIFALSVGMQSLFTGRENIYLKGAMYGMSRQEIEARIPFIEEFSELGERLDRPFGNYSSGMKARLSYSIAMATRPDVFIIDESLAVGDSAFKAKCLDNLKEYVAQPGKGVLFVSNQLRKVASIADRLLVMDKGAVIHETEDIQAGLEFYINNCYQDMSLEKQQAKLEKIRSFEL